MDNLKFNSTKDTFDCIKYILNKEYNKIIDILNFNNNEDTFDFLKNILNDEYDNILDDLYIKNEKDILNCIEYILNQKHYKNMDNIEDMFKIYKIIYYNFEYICRYQYIYNHFKRLWNNFETKFYEIDRDLTKKIYIMFFSNDVKELKTIINNKVIIKRLLYLTKNPKYNIIALEKDIYFCTPEDTDQKLYDEYLDALNEYQSLLNKFDDTDIIYENYYLDTYENELLLELKENREFNDMVDNLKNSEDIYRHKKDIIYLTKENKVLNYYKPPGHDFIVYDIKQFPLKQYYEILLYIRRLRKRSNKLREEISLIPEIGEEYNKAKEHFETLSIQ